MNTIARSKNVYGNLHTILEIVKSFLSTYWSVLLTGFLFSITRLRYLTYPLGLLHRQVINEGYRSYEAVTIGSNFNLIFDIEQPIYPLILQIGYIAIGKSPVALVFWGRAVSFIFSVLTLLLIYKISEIAIGDIAAKFAAFLYSICPYGIFMDVGIQSETLMWFFGLCALFFLLKYLETEDDRYIIVNLAFSFITVMITLTGVYFAFTSIIALILYYSGSPKGIRITVHKRIIMLCLTFIGIFLILILFPWFSTEQSTSTPLSHSIVFEPRALLDTEFWGNFIVFTVQYIPITTALLGAIGFLYGILSQKREILTLVIWTIFAGMELIFFGYGAIIHEYCVLYLLHPLVILAGNTLFLLYQSNLMQVINNGYYSIRFANPAFMLFLFLSAGFIPLFNYTEEEKVISVNEPFFEDVRSLGLFLKYYDIFGEDIAVIYLVQNYTSWRNQLTLVRTYIAKPGIKEFQTSNISEVVLTGNYKAIIGWSDDFNQSRDVLTLYFGSHWVYPQNISFQTKYDLPPIELWYNPY